MASGTINRVTLNNELKSATYTGTTSGAGILYATIPRNRLLLYFECANNAIALLNYPTNETNFLVFTIGTNNLVPVASTSVTVKYYYIEMN